MYTTANLAQYQSLDLSKEIALINPKRTPLLSFLLQNAKSVKAISNIVNWYEETLNTSAITTSKEGGDAPDDVQDATALLTNFTELLTGTAKVSNTAKSSTIVGVDDLMAREVSKKLALLKYATEDRLMLGAKAVATGSVGQKMNGLLNLINASNIVTSASSTLIKIDFEAMLKKMYDASTNDNMICFLSDTDKLAINGFYSPQYFAKDNFLGFTCDRYHTEYGDVTFVLTPSLSGAKSIVVVNPDYLELKELQGAEAIDLAVTGDSISKMVKWEGCLTLGNSKAAAKVILL
jgi:hypothetical protein